MTDNNNDYYTAAELAAKAGVTQRWIAILCLRRKLQGATKPKYSDIWLIPRSSGDRYIAERAEKKL